MIPIFTIEGQSNADGTFDVASITDPTASGYQLPYANVQMMELRSGGPAVPQTFDLDRGPVALSPRPGGTLGLFGTELSFGRGLDSVGITHAINKCSVRGASLAVDLAIGSSFDTQCVARRAFAQTQLNGYMFGCLWIQGEADANSSGFAPQYAANLTARILRDRQLHGPKFWYFINRMNTQNLGPYQDVVRAAEDYVAATLPYVRVFECSALPLIGAHFTADGTVALGRLFVNEVLAVWVPQLPKRRRNRMLSFQQGHPDPNQRTYYYTAVQAANLQNRIPGIAGSSFTVKVRKPGAASAAAANQPAELDSANHPGVYSGVLSTVEVGTPGFGVIEVTSSGMEPREIPFYVEPATFATVVTGTLTTTAFTTDRTETTDNYWKDCLVRAVDGVNAGQVKKIGAYNGTTKLFTLAVIAGAQQAFTNPFANNDHIEIITR